MLKTLVFKDRLTLLLYHSSIQMVRRSKTSKLPIAVALDDEWKSSKKWLSRLKNQVWGFKVGSILFTEQGPKIIEQILKEGFEVFLDLKFHDIPNTVEGAVKAAFSWGASVTTVHAAGGQAMLEAAASQQTKSQSVVAVSVLTSLDEKDLKTLGFSRSLTDQMISLSSLALSSGIKGLVCSPLEVSHLRSQYPKALLVTPGVRLSESHDQKRVGTLRSAIEGGSSLVVLGRALTESKNWEETWQKLISSLDGISSKKLSA